MLREQCVTLDVETYMTHAGNMAPKLVSLCFKVGTTGKTILIGNDDEAKLESALDLIFSGKYAVAGQHIQYDFAVIANFRDKYLKKIFRLYEEDKVRDTRIIDQMAHIAAGWFKRRPEGYTPKFSLDAIAERTLGIKVEGKEDADGWRKNYSKLDGISVENWPKAAADYAKTDVEVTSSIVTKQWETYAKIPTCAIQQRAGWALHLMSCWGFRASAQSTKDLEAKLLAERGKYVEELTEMGIFRPNGTKDTKRIGKLVESAYLGSKRKVPKTSTGIKTDRETLENSGDALLQSLAKVSKTDKMISTYIPMLREASVFPCNPSYQTLVESGRTSSFNPNVQQWPRKGGIRECVVPRKGAYYISSDYNVAELSSLAQVTLRLFGKSKMAEAINAGLDLHIVTASVVIGKTYQEVAAAIAAGISWAEEARQTAKILNFGLPGGLGAFALIKYAAGMGVSLTMAKATKLRNLWLATYPEVQLYFDWISSQMGVDNTGTIRHPVTGFIRGGASFTEAANHCFQNLTATGAKIALFNVAKECYVVEESALYGSRPVFFVHDEIGAESPKERASNAAKRLSAVMESSMKQVVSDVVCGAEAVVTTKCTKGAKPKFDEAGNLVPSV